MSATVRRPSDAVTAASQPVPFAPGSRLWDEMGDTMFGALTAGAFVLQVMHPVVAAGVDRHSVFRTDPVGRAIRSFDSVLLWVYGGQAAIEEGDRLRRLHAPIKGTDAQGRRYSAMDPEAYAWVHATAFVTAVQVHPLARGRAMTAREQESLYDEMLQLGEILRVPPHALPSTTREYWDMYRTTVRERLERTAVAEELLAMTHTVAPPLPEPLRTLSWPGRRAAGHLLGLTIAAGLTPDVRAILGLRYSAAQRAQLSALMALVRPVHARLPEGLRYLPLAAHARRHARAIEATRRRATASVDIS